MGMRIRENCTNIYSPEYLFLVAFSWHSSQVMSTPHLSGLRRLKIKSFYYHFIITLYDVRPFDPSEV